MSERQAFIEHAEVFKARVESSMAKVENPRHTFVEVEQKATALAELFKEKEIILPYDQRKIDPEVRNQKDEDVKNILSDLGFKIVEVNKARETLKDRNKGDEIKQEAQFFLDSVVGALTILGIENDALGRTLALSPSTTNQIVTHSLQGIGEVVTERYYEDRGVRQVILMLDQRRSNTRFNNLEAVRSLRDAENTTINSLSLNSQAYDEVTLFSAYATREVERLDRVIPGLDQRRGRQGRGQRQPEAEDDEQRQLVMSEGGSEYEYVGPELWAFTRAVTELSDTGLRWKIAPKWYKKMTRDQQYWVDTIAAQTHAVAVKSGADDNFKDWVEAHNANGKLLHIEFVMLYTGDPELEGKDTTFRVASKEILNDLFEFVPIDPSCPNGAKRLRLKAEEVDEITSEGEETGKRVWQVTSKVKEALVSSQSYILKKALQNYFPNKTEDDIMSMISGKYTGEDNVERKDYHVWLAETDPNFRRVLWNYSGAMAFISNANMFDAGDDFRSLPGSIPGIRSERISSIMHPEVKLEGKIFKGGKNITGKEEAIWGPYGAFILNYIRLHPGERDNFRNEGMMNIMPKTMGIDFLDVCPVALVTGERVSLAEALYTGEEIDLKNHLGNVMRQMNYDWNKDVWDAMNQLANIIKGKVELELGNVKSEQAFREILINSFSYIRQNPIVERQLPVRERVKDGKIRKYYKDNRGAYLPFVDDPKFGALLILSSLGIRELQNGLSVGDTKEGDREDNSTIIRDMFFKYNILGDMSVEKKNEYVDKLIELLDFEEKVKTEGKNLLAH